jgi:2,3-bisphosphoglycerate-dependent phosphoglycerate mutase
VPKIKEGKKVIISASGNSLRALIMHIDDLSPEEIVEFNMPTAIPYVYELDNDLKVISKYFLASDEDLKKALETVANQGKAK